MNIELHATQEKAKIAHEDREAFYRSLIDLANRLQPAWQFRISMPGEGRERLSGESLQRRFTHEIVKAKLGFLERQRQAGNHFPSIEHFIESTSDINEQKVRRNYLRLMAWRAVKGKFLEALCLMATLIRMTPIGASSEIDLFEQEGPLRVRDQDQPCFIWTQQSVESVKSGLKAVPDIVITNTVEKVTTKNIVSIIECKYRDSIGAGDLRGEFGKAWDLGSPSYILMSYNSVTQSVIDGGKELGIDVQVFSLNTPEREQFLRGERDVSEDMASKLALSRKRRMFLTSIENRASDVRRRGN